MGSGTTKQKATAALNAMRTIGISMNTTKPVLKNLLKIYDNNWEYIEAENYRVLADAIFDMQEPKDGGKKIGDDDENGEGKDAASSDGLESCRESDIRVTPSKLSSDLACGRLTKRARLEEEKSSSGHKRGEATSSSRNSNTKVVEPILPQSSSREVEIRSCSPQLLSENRTTGLVSPQVGYNSERVVQSSIPVNYKGTTILNEANVFASLAPVQRCLPIACKTDKNALQGKMGNPVLVGRPNVKVGTEYFGMRNTNFSSNPIREMDRPFDSDSPVFETPIAMIPPSNPILSSEGMTLDGRKSWKEKSSLEAHQRNPESLSIDDRSSCTVDIASSELGEVKLSFSCSSMQPDFRMPSLESVLKCVEDRCLNSYRILHPGFSLMNLMKEMCSCFMELGTKTTDDKHENPIQTVPAVDSSKNNSASAVPSDSSVILMSDPSSTKSGGSSQVRRVQKLKEPQLPVCARDTSLSLMMVQSQNSFSVATVRYNAADISKGEEKVRISVINEISDEIYPPHFNYLPRNIVYQNAYVNVSLARIGDEDCCPDCYDDCLAAPLPCACARETGGEFAYTSDGLIRREILDEYISMLNEPNKHHHYFCKECPIERIKNAISPEPCKGHLMRKFVKECWSKCGCSMHCGNRLVQRGITCNLQVFLTSKEKGWGVRTLDKLPRGAFVCEYVGEILTNMELYDRTIMTTGNARHTYPVLLDADWGSEGVLKDEEALCLDATFYGNVARFINHRCFDANLIGIPVEIETPDHHYYHLAFFTRRKIEAYEELTWDYCIDFDDDSHPVKAFRCRCGSRFCRDTRSHICEIALALPPCLAYLEITTPD